MKAIYVPLEPIENRCFGNWWDGFAHALNREYEHTIRISGGKVPEDAGNTGIVDTIGTTKWKLNQFKTITEMFEKGEIKNGDVFVFADLWTPGIEIVDYMARMLGVKIKITGCLHGGSWIEGDYVSDIPWVTAFESTILEMAEVVLLATHYHRLKILDMVVPVFRARYNKKLWVTGYPVEFNRIRSKVVKNIQQRDRTILYTQRIDKQKSTEAVLRAIEELWHKRQDFKFIMTSGTTKTIREGDEDCQMRMDHLKVEMGDNFKIREGLSQDEYYELLARSRVFVSMAQGETFGYSLVEAVAAGCTPVVIEGVTHNEILQNDFRFIVPDDLNMFVDRVSEYLDSPIDISHMIARYSDDHIFRSMARATKFIGSD